MGLWKDEPLTCIFFITGVLFFVKHIFLNYNEEILIPVIFLVLATYLIGHYHGKNEKGK